MRNFLLEKYRNNPEFNFVRAVAKQRQNHNLKYGLIGIGGIILIAVIYGLISSNTPAAIVPPPASATYTSTPTLSSSLTSTWTRTATTTTTYTWTPTETPTTTDTYTPTPPQSSSSTDTSVNNPLPISTNTPSNSPVSPNVTSASNSELDQ